MSKSKRPRDPNQLAKLIVDIATNEELIAKESKVPSKNQAAVELGRLGGLKGVISRAAKLTTEQKKLIAQKAARTRWNKKDE